MLDVALIIQIIFWSGTFATIGARILNVKGYWYCFALWIFGAGVIAIQTGLEGQWNIVFYQVVYIIINIWGLKDWYKLNKKGKLDALH